MAALMCVACSQSLAAGTAGIPGGEAGVRVLARSVEGAGRKSGKKGQGRNNAELMEPYVPKLDGPRDHPDPSVAPLLLTASRTP